MLKLIKGKQQWNPNANIDMSKEINLAAQMVRKDILEGITVRKSDIKGRKFTKLKPSTVRRKLKTGSPMPDTPLYHTGQMSNLSPISGENKATPSRQFASVKVARKRKYKKSNVTSLEVGQFHMAGAGSLPKRQWFGIRKKMNKKIRKMLQLRLIDKIKSKRK